MSTKRAADKDAFAAKRKARRLNSLQSVSRNLGNDFSTEAARSLSSDKGSRHFWLTPCMSKPVRSRLELDQSVHKPMLAVLSEQGVPVNEVLEPVRGNGNKQHRDQWQEAIISPSDTFMFGVRLIGDAGSPESFTPMTSFDLSCCSPSWGRVRAREHNAGGSQEALHLVAPVFTSPADVHYAIAGVLGGQIGLSMSNIEAILVFAHAIRIDCLEETCVHFLCTQAVHMQAEGLMSIMRFANHLGLSGLLVHASEALIKLPWEDNMCYFSEVLSFPMYSQDQEKLKKLLHHPKRGAYTELQVLDVLERLNASESDMLAALNFQTLQPAEQHTLLTILSSDDRPPGVLLQKAVQLQLLPEALRQTPDWKHPVRVINNLMVPDTPGDFTHYTLPQCDFKLRLEHNITEEGKCNFGAFLIYGGNARPAEVVEKLNIFSLHASAPYVRNYRLVTTLNLNNLPAGCGVGWSNLSIPLCNSKGPFTLGVWWQTPSDQ